MEEMNTHTPTGRELVRMSGIMKEFPGVKALDDVKLELYSGEVLALLGENGAGKSTLMKILSGVYQRDDGEIVLFGKKIQNWDANHAKEAGVAIIHQELNMCTHLSVAENIFLGRELVKNGRLDNERMHEETKKILHRLNIDIDPRTQVGDLAVSRQQMVEIAKALSQNARVLIMDEPTSALTSKEIDELFKIIHQLKEDGIGIIYISHRLEELQHIVDRVIIMRDGKYITQMPYDVNRMDEIIANMVGHEIKEKFPHVDCTRGKKILEVRHLSAGRQVRDVNLELYEGEIVGIAGLMGAGRTETARALFGADPKQSGKISIMDKSGQLREVTINSPQDAVKYGIGYLSEDRRRYGVVVQKSVNENTTLATMEEFTNGIFINKAKEKEVSERYVKELATKTPSGDQLVVNLSGGNQQKVVIAKWLTRDSDILIFDEPTRGIDVGAKNEIYKLMSKLAAEGKSIIMISSEMTEILRLSDRIIVMCEGKVTGNIDISEATQEHIMDKATRNID